VRNIGGTVECEDPGAIICDMIGEREEWKMTRGEDSTTDDDSSNQLEWELELVFSTGHPPTTQYKYRKTRVRYAVNTRKGIMQTA
jgi:hypothetical protein